MTRIVWTVGYGKMYPADLKTLAESLDAVVVDIRGRPISRRPGFGRRQLEELLGDRYQWRGDHMGGIYHLPNARDLWPAASRRLVADMVDGYLGWRSPGTAKDPILLCQCHAPGQCHRHMVAVELLKQAPIVTDTPIKVVHIFERESFEATELARSISENDEYDMYEWESGSDLRRAWEEL